MTTSRSQRRADAARRLAGRGSRAWLAERDAVILAHNYQLPEIQDVADHVGDSLGLSRIAASADASTIVFCGVHFMAETAKILSYDKTVLIPDARAGCSLADTITDRQLRAWKAEHPGAVVVSYVNTTAAVKAETDICCTSSNAVDVVASIPDDTEVLFCPDQFLGAHVQRAHGPREHAHLARGVPRARRHQRCRAEGNGSPRTPTPSCSSTPSAGAPPARSTSSAPAWCPRPAPASCRRAGWSTAARDTTAERVLVATETGMLHQLTKANPLVLFEPVNPAAVCKYMKMITPAKLLRVVARRPRRGHRARRRRRAGAGVGRADDRHRIPVADGRVGTMPSGLPLRLAAPAPTWEREVDVVVARLGRRRARRRARRPPGAPAS